MTIEISLLLSGVSVAFAIFFGICSKQRNEKKDTQEDAEQRATTDTMVMVKLENIADDLKDIKRESKENREEMKQFSPAKKKEPFPGNPEGTPGTEQGKEQKVLKMLSAFFDAFNKEE